MQNVSVTEGDGVRFPFGERGGITQICCEGGDFMMGLIERKNRYIALLLTVLLVFITAGCGKGGSGTESRESKDDSGQEMT